MIRFLNVAPSIIITPVFVHPSFRKAKLPTLPLFYKLVHPSDYLGSKFLWNMAIITSATDSTGCWRDMWWPLKTRLVCMYSSTTGEWHTFLWKTRREVANELRCAKTENWPNVAGHKYFRSVAEPIGTNLSVSSLLLNSVLQLWRISHLADFAKCNKHTSNYFDRCHTHNRAQHPPPHTHTHTLT